MASMTDEPLCCFVCSEEMGDPLADAHLRAKTGQQRDRSVSRLSRGSLVVIACLELSPCPLLAVRVSCLLYAHAGGTRSALPASVSSCCLPLRTRSSLPAVSCCFCVAQLDGRYCARRAVPLQSARGTCSASSMIVIASDFALLLAAPLRLSSSLNDSICCLLSSWCVSSDDSGAVAAAARAHAAASAQVRLCWHLLHISDRCVRGCRRC
jgi:hypothetical protein